MARLTIYYGRIYEVREDGIPGQTEMVEREPPIRQAVLESSSVERYGHEWVLGNLEIDDEQHIIIGRLGYPETEQRKQQDYDQAEHRFVEKVYELPHARSSAFALNYLTGALAFEAEEIGPTGFVNHFVALLNTAQRGTFKGELIRIAEDYRDFLRYVDKVVKVSFDVRPTNPRDRRIFRPLDQSMKAANANRLREVIENPDDGLVLDPPESRDEETTNPAIQGIEMVEEGFGDNYRIDAETQGQRVRFDSKGGGGLLRDVLEEGPDEPESRTQSIRSHLADRHDLIEPGAQPAHPLEAADDEGLDGHEEVAMEESEEWPEDG